MAGASNHFAKQNNSRTEWTRYIGREMEVRGSTDDLRRTWTAKLPNGTLLSSSYALLPKKDMKKFADFNIIILDNADKRIAETLTDYNTRNVNMKRLNYNSICHLRSTAHFNQRTMLVGHQKKFYWRVIPEIDLGNEMRGPEEARIFTEGLWEILILVSARQGINLRLNDDRLIALNVKYNTHQLKTIPLSELEEILEEFDIDKRHITLIDDPMHIIYEREAYKLGSPVKTYNMSGQPIMSFNQAVLYLVEQLVCGVDWRKVTVEKKDEIWRFMEESLEPMESTDHYILYSLILKRIIEFKRAFPTIHDEQVPLSTYLLHDERPGEYLKHLHEIQECAVRFGYEKNVFTNRNTQVWQLRVQGIFGAVQMFIEGVEKCNYLDMTVRDALMFLISPGRRSTYRMFFDDKVIFDLDEDEDERCRAFLKLEGREYHFHFHNKHTVRGTKSRRDILKYIPKLTKYEIHGCAPESACAETKKVRRRCRKCRAVIEELDTYRKKLRQQKNAMNNLGRCEWDRYRELREQMKVIRTKKRELKEKTLLLAMPEANQKMEFEVNSYNVILGMLEMETREEQEKCEELYRKNQALRMEEARLMSQLEVEDILNLCFNKKDGRTPGLSIFGPNGPLWIPEIIESTEESGDDTPILARKEHQYPRIARQSTRVKAKNRTKKDGAAEVLADGKVERFLEKEWAGWLSHGGEKKEEERCIESDNSKAPRRTKRAKAMKAKSFRCPDPKTLEMYVKKEIKEQIPENVEEQKNEDQLNEKLETPAIEEPIERKVLEGAEPEFEVQKSEENPETITEEQIKSEVVKMEPESEGQEAKVVEIDGQEKDKSTEVPVDHVEEQDGLQDRVPETESEVKESQEAKEVNVDEQNNDASSVVSVEEQEPPQNESPVQESEAKKPQDTPELKIVEDKKDETFEVQESLQNESPESEIGLIAPNTCQESPNFQKDQKEPDETEAADNEPENKLLEVKRVVQEALESKEHLESVTEDVKVEMLKPTPTEIASRDVKEDIEEQKKTPEGSELQEQDHKLDQENQESVKEDQEDQEVQNLQGSTTVDPQDQILETSDLPTLQEPEVMTEAPTDKKILSEHQEGLLVPLQSEEHEESEDKEIKNAQTPSTSTEKENDPLDTESPDNQPCCSSSTSSSAASIKKPMEPIQLNFMEHKDPAILIQQLFQEIKDSKNRPSRIQVDVRDKEIDEKDLTSPSSVPEDPATSLKTLKMLSNHKQSQSFELVIQTQALVEEKDRKIEELEKMCQALQAKNEKMERELSQNQPSTSTSTETQLKSEIQEKEAKISELEDTNRELHLKIKHQEEFIDKLLKR